MTNHPSAEDSGGSGAAPEVAPTPRPALSVLDLAPVSRGQSTSQALDATTTLARHAEALGYRRFWVAEHHATTSVASTSPAVLIAHLAAHTTTIRLGSGGVMLPNHPALVVAEQFALLEALHPGRIDLGIGRAPGTDPRTAAALRRSPTIEADDFPQQLLDVLELLGDGRVEAAEPPGTGQPRPQRLRATPSLQTTPGVWLLGSSGYSARLAGLLGLPFCFAAHFGMVAASAPAALQLYRDSFRAATDLEPSALGAPHAAVSAWALAAPTQAEADYLARPVLLQRFALMTGGQLAPMDSPADAAAVDLGEREAALSAMPTGGLAGPPEQVAGFLDDLSSATGADEVVLVAPGYDLATRLRSLDLVASAYCMTQPVIPRPAPAMAS